MSLPTATLPAIAGIYDAALDPKLWPSVLRRIGDLLDSTGMSIASEIDGNRTHIGSYGLSTEYLLKYTAHFRNVDPVRIHIDQAPLGIYSSHQVIPKRKLYSKEIFADFGRIYDLAYCMQGYIFRENGRAALVAACRATSKDEFTAREVKILSLLVPHLGRALNIQTTMSAAINRVNTLMAALDHWLTGVFALDGRGRMIFANQCGDALLIEADGVYQHEGILYANTQIQTAQLHSLFKRALSDGDTAPESSSILLERPSRRRALSIQVVPCSASSTHLFDERARVIVFVCDPEKTDSTAQQRLQVLYGLTPCEAALAKFISNGTGVKAAARSLGIAPSTARTHLRHVFDKMGIKRQAELANLIGRS